MNPPAQLSGQKFPPLHFLDFLLRQFCGLLWSGLKF